MLRTPDFRTDSRNRRSPSDTRIDDRPRGRYLGIPLSAGAVTIRKQLTVHRTGATPDRFPCCHRRIRWSRRVGCCRGPSSQEADGITAYDWLRGNRSRYGAADRMGLLRLARVLGLGRAYFPFGPRGSTVSGKHCPRSVRPLALAVNDPPIVSSVTLEQHWGGGGVGIEVSSFLR